jgi:hypothetical protein
MDTPSFKVDHISQMPALQVLTNLSYMSLIKQNMHNKVDGFMVHKTTLK